MLLKHSLVTTWRTLRRNKLFTLINILGLSIGISASLVIYLIAVRRRLKAGDAPADKATPPTES